MLVYKFGGASVRSAEGVMNVKNIILGTKEDLFVVVSAMGKTTNALEAVTAKFMAGEKDGAMGKAAESERFHRTICSDLFKGGMPEESRMLFERLYETIRSGDPRQKDYDYWYDRIVSYGELISTTIISAYLCEEGVENTFLDIRSYFITTNRHRDADINLAVSGKLLSEAAGTGSKGRKIFISHGFIGCTADGQTTTLGREGSDYSAAVAASLLDAESLTIWKDVDGILNADPKFFSGTYLIPEMNYLDAIELAYSGAQVIHPKTIKPLQNKNIPLYVKPFTHPEKSGSRISADKQGRAGVPVLILKKKQVLISVRPHDYSFVVEEKLPEIFELLREYNVKANLIQSSAVNLSLCVDDCRQLGTLGTELRKQGFRVVYNEGLELLTIRGYNDESFARHTCTEGILLIQKTRHNARIVRRETPDGNYPEI